MTVGLEVHVELKTLTKMFCACKNDTDEKRPNINICPVCMGHPGTLPVINKEAVKRVLKVGVAIGGQLADVSEFDRKNYFYPDIPKGYQISQYKYPLVSGGELVGVKITRVHLEEDTAKSLHVEGGASLVDFNRAGVPLMELVTEPVIKSAEEAGRFAKELQLLLQYLGVAEVNMEKGEMRVEANISVSGDNKLGTKVEVKNLNSFRSMERAIEHELKRQSELLDGGGVVVQETRGWDEAKQATFSQRSKEDSHDYRYFPDPDLPKLKISEVPELVKSVLVGEMPTTPNEKRQRFQDSYGLKESDKEFYVGNSKFADLFEKVASKIEKANFQLLSNYVLSVLSGVGPKVLELAPEDLAEIINMQSNGEISSRGAKDILVQMLAGETGARKIAETRNLFQKSNEADIAEIVDRVIGDNPKVVEEYRAGKIVALQFLVGQGMKFSSCSANPEMLRSLLMERLT